MLVLGFGVGVFGFDRGLWFRHVEPGLASCLAEESDGLLLQLLWVADVAVDDAVEIQACEASQGVRGPPSTTTTVQWDYTPLGLHWPASSPPRASIKISNCKANAGEKLTRRTRRLTGSLDCFLVHVQTVMTAGAGAAFAF